jgi:hypothetical protein
VAGAEGEEGDWATHWTRVVSARRAKRVAASEDEIFMAKRMAGNEGVKHRANHVFESH